VTATVVGVVGVADVAAGIASTDAEVVAVVEVVVAGVFDVTVMKKLSQMVYSYMSLVVTWKVLMLKLHLVELKFILIPQKENVLVDAATFSYLLRIVIINYNNKRIFLG